MPIIICTALFSAEDSGGIQQVIVLTKSTTFVIRWIADLLGLLMNGIFFLIEKIGIPNVGLAIILFTLVIYLAMTPLQVKQQKFSKLNAVMQPEIKAIQKKYQGRKDQVSMQKQNEEIQAVYAKYGVSAAGSCLQLGIQLPILFALYQVIYHIPGYITNIGDKLTAVATTAGFSDFFKTFVDGLESRNLSRLMGDWETENIVDVLYNLSTDNWASLKADTGAAAFSDILTNTHQYIERVTSFLTLNISDSPSIIFMNAWHNKTFLMMLVAILIPVFAYLTQILNIKLIPQPETNKKNDNESDTMTATMKSMNTFMPIMSAFICFTLPVGIGIYWIAGALIRSVQQLVINKHFDKVGVDRMIEEQKKEAEKKLKNKGTAKNQISQAAATNTKRIGIDKKIMNTENIKDPAKDNASVQYKEGSIAAKANLARGLDTGKRKKK